MTKSIKPGINKKGNLLAHVTKSSGFRYCWIDLSAPLNSLAFLFCHPFSQRSCLQSHGEERGEASSPHSGSWPLEKPTCLPEGRSFAPDSFSESLRDKGSCHEEALPVLLSLFCYYCCPPPPPKSLFRQFFS